MKSFLLSLIILLVTQVSSSAFAKVRVAVIDTGAKIDKPYFCKTGHKDFTGTGMNDSHEIGHGSIIAEIIAKYNQGEFCIIMLKAFNPKFNNLSYIRALTYAYKMNYDIINLSITGRQPIYEEKTLILKMLQQKQIIVSAAGNDGLNFDESGCIIYPACIHDRIIVVSSKQSPLFNTGKVIDYYNNAFYIFNNHNLKGTSFAVPYIVGTIAKKLGKLND